MLTALVILPALAGLASLLDPSSARRALLVGGLVLLAASVGPVSLVLTALGAVVGASAARWADSPAA